MERHPLDLLIEAGPDGIDRAVGLLCRGGARRRRRCVLSRAQETEPRVPYQWQADGAGHHEGA